MNTLLTSFRKSKNLSMKEMAYLVGVSKSYYEKIEYEQIKPSFNFITKFKVQFPCVNTEDMFINELIHRKSRVDEVDGVMQKEFDRAFSIYTSMALDQVKEKKQIEEFKNIQKKMNTAQREKFQEMWDLWIMAQSNLGGI